MLADHRDGLSNSSFCLILDSSVGLSAGIQSAGDWVSETPWVRILRSAEEDNLSPLDSKIACLCQSMEIYNNKHIYTERTCTIYQGVATQLYKSNTLYMLRTLDAIILKLWGVICTSVLSVMISTLIVQHFANFRSNPSEGYCNIWLAMAYAMTTVVSSE